MEEVTAKQVELEELSHLEADNNITDTSKSSRTSSGDSDAPVVQDDETGVELEDHEEDDGPITADSKKVRKRKAKLTKLITDVENVKTKRLQTAVYCVAYIALGFIVGSLGPSLLLLADNVGETSDTIGSLFSARGAGWITGSIISGFLYKKFKAHPMMFISLITLVVCSFVTPFVAVFPLLLLVTAVVGFCGAVIDVGANTMIVQVWKQDSTPYLQFLHFNFGVGSTLSPSVIGGVMALSENNKLLWSYITLGFLIAACAVFPIVIQSPPVETADEGGKKIKCEMSRTTVHYYGIVFSMALYLFLYVGAEVAYGGWIFTFGVKFYDMADWIAAYLSSAFWLFITLGRLLAVPLATKLSNKTLLLINMGGCFLSVSMLILFGHLKSQAILWISTCGYGLFMASIFATAYSLPQYLGLDMDSTASSILICGSSLGDILVPMFVGMLMTKHGQYAMLLTVWSVSIILLAIYVAVVHGLHKYLGPRPGDIKQIEEAENVLSSNDETTDNQTRL